MAYTGIACFAGMNKNFPIKKVLRAYPKTIETPATAILHGYFGNSWEFPNSFCDKFSDRPHCIEWHLCFRNAVNTIPNKARKIMNRMDKIGNSNTELVFCPVLEDACSNEEFKMWAKKVKNITGCRIVRNPYSGGHRWGFYEEHHGTNPSWRKKPGRQIYNPDGLSVDFKDGDKYFNRCSIEYFQNIVSDEMFMWLIWYAPLQGFKDCRGWTDKPPVSERQYLISRKAVKGMKNILKQSY